MPEPIEAIANIDRLVHEPVRLAILTALDARGASADFMELWALTRVSRGNLSLHISRLEAHKLVEIEKMFRGKMPCTVVRLTKEGKTAIRAHWRTLETARRLAERWFRQA